MCHSLIWKGFGVGHVTSADGGNASSSIGVVDRGCSAIGIKCFCWWCYRFRFRFIPGACVIGCVSTSGRNPHCLNRGSHAPRGVNNQWEKVMFVFYGAQVRVQAVSFILRWCCWKCTLGGWDWDWEDAV